MFDHKQTRQTLRSANSLLHSVHKLTFQTPKGTHTHTHAHIYQSKCHKTSTAFPVRAMKTYTRVELQLHSLLTSALHGGKLTASHCSRLEPEKTNPSRTPLDNSKQSLDPAKNKTTVPWSFSLQHNC